MDIAFAIESDLNACAECFLASEVARRYEYTHETILGRLTVALAKGELWVAKEQGDVLGYVCVVIDGPFYSEPYLSGIAVRESCRSKGIGSRLLAFFEETAFSVSDRVFLLVGDYNVRAQEFYRSKGYFEVRRIPDFSKAGIAELIMVKRRVAATPNQALEPTGLASTPRADARVAPAKPVAHH
jgi:ribosomal protein S18 acetylase RimI-like enzyme